MSERIQFIKQVRDEVLSRMKSEKDAREFVMEELNAGSLGSMLSRSFVKGSGIDINAMDSSNVDAGIAQQYLSKVCTHNTRSGLPMEEVLMCRLAVLDLVMQQYLFGKYGRGKYKLIEKIVLEKQADRKSEIYIHEHFIIHKFVNAEHKTYLDSYFKHTDENSTYYISPIYGYISVQNSRVVETSFEGEKRISQISEKA